MPVRPLPHNRRDSHHRMPFLLRSLLALSFVLFETNYEPSSFVLTAAAAASTRTSSLSNTNSTSPTSVPSNTFSTSYSNGLPSISDSVTLTEDKTISVRSVTISMTQQRSGTPTDSFLNSSHSNTESAPRSMSSSNSSNASVTVSLTSVVTRSLTLSRSLSSARSSSRTLSGSPTLSSTPSRSNSASQSVSASPTATSTPSETLTLSPPRTPTPKTRSNTTTFSQNPTRSVSPSEDITASNTTSRPTHVPTPTNSTSMSVTQSTSPSLTATPSASRSRFTWTSLLSPSHSNYTQRPTYSGNMSSHTATSSISASMPRGYTVPSAVFSSKQVLDHVFVAKVTSFLADFTSVSAGAFTYDLFVQMKAAARKRQLPKNALYFLTDDLAALGTVMPIIRCKITSTLRVSNDFFNVSVCHNDDMGPSCTVSSRGCKVAGVVSCTCPSQWTNYPPRNPIDVTSIPGTVLVPPPTPVPSTPPPPPPPPPTTTVAPMPNASTTSNATNRRLMLSLATTNEQLEFVFRLENAPAFRPQSVQEVIDTYEMLRVLTVDALSSTALVTAYLLDRATVNTTDVFFTPVYPAPPEVIISSAAFLPIAAVLLFLVVFLVYAGYKLYKYIRWRRTVGAFRVAPAEGEVDDREMTEKLGTGTWVFSGGGAGGGGGADVIAIATRGGGGGGAAAAAAFDPLADLRKAEVARGIGKNSKDSVEGGGGGGDEESDLDRSQTSSGGEGNDEESGGGGGDKAAAGGGVVAVSKREEKIRTSLACASRILSSMTPQKVTPARGGSRIGAASASTPSEGVAALLGSDAVATTGALGAGLLASPLRALLEREVKASAESAAAATAAAATATPKCPLDALNANKPLEGDDDGDHDVIDEDDDEEEVYSDAEEGDNIDVDPPNNKGAAGNVDAKSEEDEEEEEVEEEEEEYEEEEGDDADLR